MCVWTGNETFRVFTIYFTNVCFAYVADCDDFARNAKKNILLPPDVGVIMAHLLGHWPALAQYLIRFTKNL